MTRARAVIVEELIEELESKMMLAIEELDMLKADTIGGVIDWLKKEKNK